MNLCQPYFNFLSTSYTVKEARNSKLRNLFVVRGQFFSFYTHQSFKSSKGFMAEEYEEGVIEGNQPPFNNQYQESVGEEGKKEENYFLNVLFVSRYRYSNTTENHIREAFEQFGPIKDIFVKTNFSFVEFVNPEDAHKAKHSMHHHPGLGSDSLIVDFKKDGVPKVWIFVLDEVPLM